MVRLTLAQKYILVITQLDLSRVSITAPRVYDDVHSIFPARSAIQLGSDQSLETIAHSRHYNELNCTVNILYVTGNIY